MEAYSRAPLQVRTVLAWSLTYASGAAWARFAGMLACALRRGVGDAWSARTTTPSAATSQCFVELGDRGERGRQREPMQIETQGRSPVPDLWSAIRGEGEDGQVFWTTMGGATALVDLSEPSTATVDDEVLELLRQARALLDARATGAAQPGPWRSALQHVDASIASIQNEAPVPRLGRSAYAAAPRSKCR